MRFFAILWCSAACLVATAEIPVIAYLSPISTSRTLHVAISQVNNSAIAELHHSFISHLNDSVRCRYQRTKLLSCILVLVLTVPANGSWRPMPSPNQSRHSREMLSISTGNWVLITVVQAIGKNFTQANGKGTAIYRFSAFEAGRAFLPFLYRTFRYTLFPKNFSTPACAHYKESFTNCANCYMFQLTAKAKQVSSISPK